MARKLRQEWLVVSLYCSISVVEYASLAIGVVQLCTVRSDAPASSQKNLRGGQHAQCRRNEIDPKRVPVAGVNRGTKCSCGIHAHPRQRCFKCYECHIQPTDTIRRVSCQRFAIGYEQDGSHQNKRDRHFRNECPSIAIYAGHCGRVANRVATRRAAQQPPGDRDTANCARELRGGVKHRIRQLHVSQPVKSKGYRWIEVASGLFAHGVMTIAITIAPIANPISARRKTSSTIKCRTGEAGCCNKVANAHAKNMYKASSPASIRYSGQWTRNLPTAFIAPLFAILLAAHGDFASFRQPLQLLGLVRREAPPRRRVLRSGCRCFLSGSAASPCSRQRAGHAR